MSELVQWLGEQLDEDERIARSADAELSNVFTRIGTFDPDMASDERHIMLHRPAWVLREIDAKRQVLTEYEQAARYSRTTWGQSNANQSRARTLGKVVRLLALPYADRPGYREEWRP